MWPSWMTRDASTMGSLGGAEDPDAFASGAAATALPPMSEKLNFPSAPFSIRMLGDLNSIALMTTLPVSRLSRLRSSLALALLKSGCFSKPWPLASWTFSSLTPVKRLTSTFSMLSWRPSFSEAKAVAWSLSLSQGMKKGAMRATRNRRTAMPPRMKSQRLRPPFFGAGVGADAGAEVLAMIDPVRGGRRVFVNKNAQSAA